VKKVEDVLRFSIEKVRNIVKKGVFLKYPLKNPPFSNFLVANDLEKPYTGFVILKTKNYTDNLFY
jgi:hypothetical protein